MSDQAAMEEQENTGLTLDEQLAFYKGKRFIAMPIAGMIIWTIILVGGQLIDNLGLQQLLVYVCTGVTAYVGMALSRLTGENMVGGSHLATLFDKLFLASAAQAILVFAIAIPYALVDPRSTVFSVGVLAGLMWLPLSIVLGHWVGVFHAVARTALCTIAYLALPVDPMLSIPVIILAVYAVSLWGLETRWRAIGTKPDGTAR